MKPRAGQVTPRAGPMKPRVFRPERHSTNQPRATPWGTKKQSNQALKGRNNLRADTFCFALSGLPMGFLISFPGRCPGLICYGPLGAKKNARSKRARRVRTEKESNQVFRPERPSTNQPRATPWGTEQETNQALKGRNSLRADTICFALSGLPIGFLISSPGRCPGLICYGPLGAGKSATSKRARPASMHHAPTLNNNVDVGDR